LLQAHLGLLSRGIHRLSAGLQLPEKAVDILPDDTAEVLQRRVMEQAEWVLLPQATELLCKQLVDKAV